MEKYDIVKEIKRHKIPYHSMNNIRQPVGADASIAPLNRGTLGIGRRR
jgi:hypothetical protein